MSLPAVVTTHVEEARRLLITQFRGKPVIEGFLDTHVRRLQDIENYIWEMIDARILSTATNAQLDCFGVLVGEARRDRTDVDYRTAISLRILVNRSKGRIKDVLEVAMLAANPLAAPRVTEYRYLGFEVEIYEQLGERYIAELISDARAASSYGVLVASDLTWEELLVFDDDVTPIAGVETFSDYVSGTGQLAAAGYGMPSTFANIVDGAYAHYGEGPFGDFLLGS